MEGTPDLWKLYGEMYRSRLFEEIVSQVWEEGLISGEMHLAMGEEAICAGIVTQLVDGDAMALDHRGTPPMLMRGVSPASLLQEFLGLPAGLCRGHGGHMHLYSPGHLAASSGIVGASGPAACGFALAAQQQGTGGVTVAFFGDGAMNQGMLLESLNLAAAWKLPVIFVCKDDGWAITTRSGDVTGGGLSDRAHAFGIHADDVDGTDVEEVWQAAASAIERARSGAGPTFIHATCSHLEGHFLGDQLLRISRRPVKEMTPLMGPLTKAFLSPKGTSVFERVRNIVDVSTRAWGLASDQTTPAGDPVHLLRRKLAHDVTQLDAVENAISEEIQQAVVSALAGVSERGA